MTAPTRTAESWWMDVASAAYDMESFEWAAVFQRIQADARRAAIEEAIVDVEVTAEFWDDGSTEVMYALEDASMGLRKLLDSGAP